MSFWLLAIRVELIYIAGICAGFVAAYWTVPHKTTVGWHLVRVTALLGGSALFAAVAQLFDLDPETKRAAWAALLLGLAIEMTTRTWMLITSRRDARREMRRLRLIRDSGESEPTQSVR